MGDLVGVLRESMRQSLGRYGIGGRLDDVAADVAKDLGAIAVPTAEPNQLVIEVTFQGDAILKEMRAKPITMGEAMMISSIVVAHRVGSLMSALHAAMPYRTEAQIIELVEHVASTTLKSVIDIELTQEE